MYDDAIAEGKCAVLLEEKLGGMFIACMYCHYTFFIHISLFIYFLFFYLYIK